MTVLELEAGDEGKGVHSGDEMEIAEEILERAGGKEVKEKLGANTERAFGDGAFGLPWVVGEFDFLACWVRVCGC